ncbi:MAG: shikimate kinase [Verrucomicrobia bacterium]|jgi:shikimate kinase|nr:shikimate kinase [Verrucomicrobiota bacterium]
MANYSNIVLFGFMGTGKTRIGKEAAARLGLVFVDMDDVIVERAGKPIPEIFADDGEAHFRSIERQAVIDLSAQPGCVIATGGGVVLNSDNIRDFSQDGLVVCLSATPEVILARVEHDTNRPLLNADDKMEKICSLLDSRQVLYDAIPNQIDTSELTATEVVDRIVSLYQQ